MLNWLCYFFIANVPHDWILCRILVIRNSRVQMMLPWRTSLSPQSLYFSFSSLGDTLIITSGITWGWSIFQTLQLSKYFYSTFPTRREISGCTSAHNCTVTTHASINFHIIFNYNTQDICLQQFLRNTAKGSLHSCAYLIIVTPSPLGAII